MFFVLFLFCLFHDLLEEIEIAGNAFPFMCFLKKLLYGLETEFRKDR